MKTKRILTAVTSLLLAFGICAMSACEGVTVTPDGEGGVVVKPINPGNITVTPDGNGGVTITPGGETTSDGSTSETPETPNTSETPSGGENNENNGNTETPVVPDTPQTPTPDTPKPDTPTPDTPIDPTPTPDTPPVINSDKGDLATSDYITTKIIDKWIAHSTLTVQNEVISSTSDSTSALKGTFSAKDADETYDSSQDPSGDGGQWAWTALTLDFKEMCGSSADLDGYTFYFDVKTENSDTTSSMILYNSAKQRSTQVPFNNDPTNPYVASSDIKGLSKQILSNGWVRISVDLDTTFAGYDKAETDELYIIFSNAYGDYSKDVVFYVDNMCFINSQNRVETPGPIKADLSDLGKADCISTTKLGAWMVDTELKLQKSVTNGSKSAIRGSFNVKNASEWYDSTQDPSGDGGKWVWSAFTLDVSKLYSGSANLNGLELSFDVKVKNGSTTTSLTYIDQNGFRPTELPVNNSTDKNNVSHLSGFKKTVLTDGWVRITADLGMLFGQGNVSQIDKIILIFSNATGDYVNDTVYYIDNICFNPKSK